MSTKINYDCMSLEINGHVIATAECREHAAARREPPTGGLVGTGDATGSGAPGVQGP
jgi:hypothetical protein